jgi:hypothetical protein
VGLSACSFGLFSRLPATPVQRNIVAEKKEKACNAGPFFIKQTYIIWSHSVINKKQVEGIQCFKDHLQALHFFKTN